MSKTSSNKASTSGQTRVTRIKAQAKPSQADKKAAANDKTSSLKAKPIAKAKTKAKASYLRGSFQELRQVKWPSRKEAWSMTLAVIIYAAILMAIVLLLDNFFDWGFKLIIK